MAIKNVLIVDDDIAHILHLQTLLAGAGYVVSTANNGQEAVTKARSDHPDAILMDINMPVMDGFAAARGLKNGADTKAKGYVTKPYRPDEILEQLKTLG